MLLSASLEETAAMIRRAVPALTRLAAPALADAPARRRLAERFRAFKRHRESWGWEVLFRAIPRKCLQQQSCLDPSGCSFMGDNNVVVDVFVRDRQTGTIEQATSYPVIPVLGA
jgi:hypothetical protein